MESKKQIKTSDMKNPFPFPTEEFIETWNDWLEYKKGEFGFKFKTEQSKKASLKKLYNLSGGEEKIAIAILEEAMSNGYRGFFALKQDAINKINVNSPKQVTAAGIFLSQFNGTNN